MSAKKILLVGFIFVLLAAIPLTVYLVQQEQKTKSGATPATTISLIPKSQTINNGATGKLDVQVSPGSANQVSFVKFTINYDSNYLATVSAGTKCSNSKYVNDAFCPNTDKFPQVMQGPTYDDGKISVTLSVGNSPDKAVTGNNVPVGTVYFQALAPTTGTDVTFSDPPDTQILSIGSNDQFNENVVTDRIKATIIVPAAAVTDTPTFTPTPTTGQASAAGPTCTSLTVSPANSGAAPLNVNLTVSGQSSSSTISKITFNFGDGQTQDITDSGGVGTNSISALQSHTYTTLGNYTATAILTDASGKVSPVGSCTVAINANNGTATTTNTTTTTTTDNTVTTEVTATPTITSTPLQNEQTGPRDLITIGSIGAAITAIGAILLLAL
jgi:hypothetical protein